MKPGDRVSVYGAALPGTRGAWTGMVTTPLPCDSVDVGEVVVIAEYGGYRRAVHPKQCRKLIKKRVQTWLVPRFFLDAEHICFPHAYDKSKGPLVLVRRACK